MVFNRRYFLRYMYTVRLDLHIANSTNKWDTKKPDYCRLCVEYALCNCRRPSYGNRIICYLGFYKRDEVVKRHILWVLKQMTPP